MHGAEPCDSAPRVIDADRPLKSSSRAAFGDGALVCPFTPTAGVNGARNRALG